MRGAHTETRADETHRSDDKGTTPTKQMTAPVRPTVVDTSATLSVVVLPFRWFERSLETCIHIHCPFFFWGVVYGSVVCTRPTRRSVRTYQPTSGSVGRSVYNNFFRIRFSRTSNGHGARDAGVMLLVVYVLSLGLSRSSTFYRKSTSPKNYLSLQLVYYRQVLRGITQI